MIVALYARVSTTKQAEKELSIPDQLRQMHQWCKQQGYSVAMEYQELGASATDDRRPVFQQMIQESCVPDAPFDAIIVHSLSRFFRDALEFGLYERQLNKHGVQVISITQQTSSDPSGEMARRIFSLFDEYQSKENAKHTLRAMKENARQGYHNGSIPPYGYRTVEILAQGKQAKKRRLEIDLAEATIVRKIFDLYLNGYQGKLLGMSQIAAVLNQRHCTRRGKRWIKTTVANLLQDSTYVGEYYFNKVCAKTRIAKPNEERILVNVPPIIEKELFERVAQQREARSPQNTPPRVVNSPTLLTGVLKCSCGAGMTLATGKGGRYRYYKCSSRITAGKQSCSSRNIPMEKLDQIIIEAITERVFTPQRVEAMLKELRERLKTSRSKHDNELESLKKELNDIQQATDRLYAAVESGMLPNDISLAQRAHKHHARRQEILTEMSGLKRKQQMPFAPLGKKSVQTFCSALRDKMLDKESNFRKEYLRLLVDEVSIEGNEVRIRGSHAALAGVLHKTKVGHLEGVPTFGSGWLPLTDSNDKRI